jgi:hypothetical protein
MMATDSSIYQSDGLCYNFCNSDWAYAIVQGEDCWCSNYTPDSSSQVDTSKCNSECPGYPSDTCGADGLYGYMALSSSPSGTKGGATATSTGTQVSLPSVFLSIWCLFSLLCDHPWPSGLRSFSFAVLKPSLILHSNVRQLYIRPPTAHSECCIFNSTVPGHVDSRRNYCHSYSISNYYQIIVDCRCCMP